MSIDIFTKMFFETLFVAKRLNLENLLYAINMDIVKYSMVLCT